MTTLTTGRLEKPLDVQNSRLPTGPITIAMANYHTMKAWLLWIRFSVFVEEQRVAPELERDEQDAEAYHWLVWVNGQPVGTARAIVQSDDIKIGRVAILPAFRGQGLASSLMQTIHNWAVEQGFTRTVLDAQCVAQPFYSQLGYQAQGDIFDDAGIEHIRMVRMENPCNDSERKP